MKALSVKQPWANLIADGTKSIEVRSWQTKYRGPLLIVSSITIDRSIAALKFAEKTPRGVSICTVNLTDIRPAYKKDSFACGGFNPKGLYAWILSDPVKLKAVPIKGHLLLFNIDPCVERLLSER